MGLAVLVAGTLACAPKPKPSILLVTIDTLRADHVGCYGDASAETPTLDGLAAIGLRFDEARSHVPLTAPSHATILTGCLPPQHGVRGNGPFRLRPEAPALAVALRNSGYHTAAVVASVVLDRATGLDRGFDTYDDNQRRGPRSAFQYLERGASQIEESAAQTLAHLKPPFFLWVHFYDPHVPWVAPDMFAERHPGHGYDAEIAFADAAAGKIVEAARRVAPDLVVAIAADHGESLGEHGENQHGYTLHRGVLRVPLILAGPGIPRGATVKATVGLVDLAPTLADLAGVAYPKAYGRSLRRFFGEGAHSDDDSSRPLFEETLHPLFDSGWAPLRGALGKNWHFVDAPRPELYDRARDPSDNDDLAARRPEIVDDQKQQLRTLEQSLGDVEEPEIAAAVTADEKERREKLSSLGYVAASTPKRPQGRLNPKDGLPGFIAVEEAERLLEEGQPAAGRDRVTPFLERDPDNPRLWHTLAKARAGLGDLHGAEEAIKRALALSSPALPFLRYTYADILWRLDDAAGATRQLELILADDPRAVDASLELASVAFRRGDREGSRRILLAAYDAGARDPDLLDRLGQDMLDAHQDEKAARFFAEALALWPNDPAALLAEGRAAIRRNEPARAIEPLARCARVGVYECRMELARAYVLGPHDLDAAKQQLVAARAQVKDPRLIREIDQHLAAVESMRR